MPTVYLRGIYGFVGAVAGSYHNIKCIASDLEINYPGWNLLGTRPVGTDFVYRIGADLYLLRKRKSLIGIGGADRKRLAFHGKVSCFDNFCPCHIRLRHPFCIQRQIFLYAIGDKIPFGGIVGFPIPSDQNISRLRHTFRLGNGRTFFDRLTRRRSSSHRIEGYGLVAFGFFYRNKVGINVNHLFQRLIEQGVDRKRLSPDIFIPKPSLKNIALFLRSFGQLDRFFAFCVDGVIDLIVHHKVDADFNFFTADQRQSKQQNENYCKNNTKRPFHNPSLCITYQL